MPYNNKNNNYNNNHDIGSNNNNDDDNNNDNNNDNHNHHNHIHQLAKTDSSLYNLMPIAESTAGWTPVYDATSRSSLHIER